jgi:hypothetical protein
MDNINPRPPAINMHGNAHHVYIIQNVLTLTYSQPQLQKIVYVNIANAPFYLTSIVQ